MNHIMIDLETLDRTPTSVVTALGAVRFDPKGTHFGDTFYAVTTDWSEQQKHGRTIDGETVKWWFQQEPGARDALVVTNNGRTTRDMLVDFASFIGEIDEVKVWGNGADFDCVILGSLYEAYGIRRPWSYGGNRCYRTMKNLPHTVGKAKRVGVHHNALDDALTQAQHLQEIYAWLKSTTTS